MAETKKTETTREALIAGLQDDLAREYKAIIQYVIYSQKLDSAKYMSIATELEAHAHEELDHAIAIANQLDYLGEYPVHEAKPVEVPEDNEGMLWADLRAEDETIENYRTRIHQAEELGEFAISEVLRGLVVNEQDHQMELATALGVPPHPSQRKNMGPKTMKPK